MPTCWTDHSLADQLVRTVLVVTVVASICAAFQLAVFNRPWLRGPSLVNEAGPYPELPGETSAHSRVAQHGHSTTFYTLFRSYAWPDADERQDALPRGASVSTRLSTLKSTRSAIDSTPMYRVAGDSLPVTTM